MAKGKSKIDFKQFLLNKGEYLAMGLAGFFLVVLLGWGVSRWAGAKDPEKISKDLTNQAQSLQSRIRNGEPTEDEMKMAALPPWMQKPYEHKPISADDFRLTGPQFDPIARPDTKRENPIVLPLGEFQADVLKAPMKGFDIVNPREGEYLIGVVVSKKVSEQDKDKVKALGKKINTRIRANQKNYAGRPNPGGMPPGGFPPGGFPPGGGMPPGGYPPGGGMPPVGGPDGEGSGMYGGMYGGGGYNTTAQRVDRALSYVSLDELDSAIKEQKVPATTVIPLRAVIIHMEVPYRQQLEELKRALRLTSIDEARRYGPRYDGYEVQRRVTRTLPDGSKVVIVDWPADVTKPNYDFEAKYAELINARKLRDQIEDGWMLHFLRYDMALSLPLPELVEELGSYPGIRLPGINATVEKLKAAQLKPEVVSDLLNRMKGKVGREGLYKPTTGADTGASELGYGSGADMGGPPGMRPPGSPQAPGGGLQPPGSPLAPGGGLQIPGGREGEGEGGVAVAPPVEIDHLLMRFLDVDVQPGNTYEYRIRLKMENPNYGKANEKIVSNPAYTKKKTLYSPWTKVAAEITIPNEDFKFAVDPAAYRTRIAEEFKDSKDRDVRERLQAKDNQAVIEMARWMEEVPIGSGKREPVGAWVVADIPTGRGEYLGRKHYVKLPLWSAVTSQYVLREVADRIVTGRKDTQQPKGWLVDFTTKDILVDFEGGKVKTRTRSNREVTEDVATEMLIVREDGQLEVKKSIEDEANSERKKLVEGWESWTKNVERRKDTAPDGGFDRGGEPGGSGR